MTGGAGFLGSHLCTGSSRDGHDVVSVDNYFTSSRRNLAHILSDPRFEALRHDVCFPFYVEVDRSTISPVRPRRSTISAIRFRRRRRACTAPSTCSASPSAFMPASCRPRPRRFTAIRSSIRRAKAIGGMSIRSARGLLRRRQALRRDAVLRLLPAASLEIKVARIFNTYGPRMHPNDGRVVSNFIVQALEARAPHRLRRRPPDAELLLCRRSDQGAGPVHGQRPALTGPVNLGNPVELTMLELAELIFG